MGTAFRNRFYVWIAVFFETVLFSQISNTSVLTGKNQVYSNYYVEMDYKIKDSKLNTLYLVTKEIHFLNDKSVHKNYLTVQYQDYYCINRQFAAAHLKAKKNGRFKKKKIKLSYKKNVRAKGIFYDDAIEEEFYYPNVKAGDKIRLTFKTDFTNPTIVPKVFFNQELPAEKITYKVNIPDFVKVKLILVGDSTGITHRTQRLEKSLVHYYEVTNRAGIEFDEGSPGVLHYTPHLVTVPESYLVNDSTVNLVGNLQNLFEYYKVSLQEMAPSNDSVIYKLTDSLVVGIKDTSEQIRMVYDWVQKNVKYIAFEEGRGGYVPRPAEKVFVNRYGDCKDKANLLVVMLEHLKIPAYHTWIGTREKPYNYEQMPSPHCDNHMITTVFHKGSYFFLDATSTFGNYEMPSYFIQGKQAFIKKGDNYLLKYVPVIEADKSVTSDSITIRLQKDKLVGKNSCKLSGYFSEVNAHRLQDANWSEAALKENIEIGNNKLVINNFRYYLNSSSTCIDVNYDFELPNYVQEFDDEVYLNPHLIKNLDNELIDAQKRKVDIEENYKYILKDNIVLELVNNEKVVSIPKNVSLKEDGFSFEITYLHENKKIEINKVIKVNHLLLKTIDFDKWNKMVNELSDAYSNVIVFKKN